MGLDLMDSFPTYLQSIRNMDRALKSLTEAPSWTIEGRSHPSCFHCLGARESLTGNFSCVACTRGIEYGPASSYVSATCHGYSSCFG